MTRDIRAAPPERSPMSVASQLVSWSRRAPEAPAIQETGAHWTYQELAATAGKIEAMLRSSGIGEGDRVVVRGRSSAVFVSAFLGILRSRAVAVPVDVGDPPLYTKARLERLRPKLRLELEDDEEPIPPLDDDVPVLPLPTRKRWWSRHRRQVSAPVGGCPPGADDPAYILHTSGSTGEPRGVEVSHRPLPHFLSWYTRRFAISRADRFAVLTSVSYDPYLRDVFAPLWAGGTAVLPPGRILGEPLRILEWLSRQRISILHCAPARLRELLSHVRSPSCLGSLRRVFLHGDVARWGDVEDLRRAAPGARCASFYGATETPQAMAWYEAEWHRASPAPAYEPLPLGRAIDGVDLLVEADGGRLAGPAEYGEILIRSRYLALGYADEPALTAARFIGDLHSGRAGQRVFRSGDLGAYRDDGCLGFAGRADSMVKIRGCRVEPLRVEQALLSHPAVREAKVGTEQDPGSGELRLVAWLSSSGSGADLDALRRHLEPRLPVKMIPELRLVDRLARDGRGKALAGAAAVAVGGATW